MFEYRMLHKNSGDIVWVKDIVHVVVGSKGPEKLQGVFIDITGSKQKEQALRKSLEEKDVLLREVHHRVKNNMAVISALLNMQSAYIKNPEDLEMLKESQGRIMAMALVHEKIYKTESFVEIDVEEYLHSLAESIRSSLAGGSKVDVKYDVENVSMSIDFLIPCGLIVNELLTNSFKHAFNGTGRPEIRIKLELIDNKDIRLSISDNGAGLPDGFDVNQTTGLGLKLVTALCKQIMGTLEYKSDHGTAFTLIFPKEIPLARA
jgi:two-component sensor histidine kinase